MDGVLNIYKPSDITSFDVVRKVMKICNTKKVGHTGTLDPLATGVLPVCIGRATKIVDYIMSDIKVYKAQLMLGMETDTYDREGTILNENKVTLTQDEVTECFKHFIGEIEQEPPMYSALKVNGKRLYELARQGIVIDREKRKISIYDLTIIDISLPLVTFSVTCSKGTYIRSLCSDIGKELGVGGTMWALERVQSGIFKKEDSIDLSLLDKENAEKYVIPLEHALRNYEQVSFDSKFEKLLLNGVKLNNIHIINHVEKNKLLRVYVDNSKFLGLGFRDDSGFKIVKLLI